PKVENVQVDFKRAQAHAEAAAVDPEIESVGPLLKLLEEGLKFFQELQATIQVHEEEANTFQDLDARFDSKLQEVQRSGGISSAAQLNSLKTYMESLK